MSEMTDGQAACIAWNAHYAEEHGIEARNEWAASDPRGHAAWEAAATAAQAPIRAAITALISELKTTAAAAHPSKRSEIEFEIKRKLEDILEHGKENAK